MNTNYTGEESLASILSKHQVRKSGGTRPLNTNWEEAKNFGDKFGLKTPFVMKLFKSYGKQKVLNLYSYLADFPNTKGKGMEGLIIYKLKEVTTQ